MSAAFYPVPNMRENVQRLRHLAWLPFTLESWAPQLQAFGWGLQAHSLWVWAERGHEQITYRRSVLAQLSFDARELSQSLYTLGDDRDGRLIDAAARSKFSDAFAELEREFCEAIGAPDFRLFTTVSFFPHAILLASVWCCGENDLYLMQDIGDQAVGEDGFISLRILRKQDQPARLPLSSVFHT